ncbi:hypothetical protein BU198_39030 [Streptomyces sp. CBMA156]|nr:hypothetical protein [Streptomyces sp. CBMA156]
MTTLNASSLSVDVPDVLDARDVLDVLDVHDVLDIDVDVDLLLDGDDTVQPPDTGVPVSGAPVLMTPPQSTQMDFEFDAQGCVQLDPPVQLVVEAPTAPVGRAGAGRARTR